jgi:hypothetical protein
MHGDGSITGPEGGEATFGFEAAEVTKKKKTKTTGSLSYSDPSSGISFRSNKITSLAFSGHQAYFSGTAKNGKSTISFTVDATDNGDPGTLDTFSIHLSTGYSASGRLTSGSIATR